MLERKYAIILGNLGNTKDRFCGGYKQNPSTLEMLKQAQAIPHARGIELVGSWDIHPDNVKEMKAGIKDLGWECVSIIPDLFANPTFSRGSYSSKDPKERRQAIDYTKKMCDIAMELKCPLLNLWPGQDGYDYIFTADYLRERDWIVEAVTELAQAYPKMKFALEYKPKEPRTHSYLARTADTLLLAQETGCSNVGITIDTGHALMGGELVAEAITLAHRAGEKLFHMHFNDNYASWDDDMIVGSVHSLYYLEILYWLDRIGYDGWLSMDQYPYREDAVGAISESISWLCKFDTLQRTHQTELNELLKLGDAVKTSRVLREIL